MIKRPRLTAAQCLAAFATVLLSLTARADAPNLIQNGGFDQVENGKAKSWDFDSDANGIFKLQYVQLAGHGAVAEMSAGNAGISSYMQQQIAVKKNTKYRLTAMTRVFDGTGLIYIHGTGANNLVEKGRCYIMDVHNHPLVPGFWKKSWVQGSENNPEPWRGTYRNYLAEPGEWLPVSMDFESGELEAVNISLGIYFLPGKYYYDDIKVTQIS